MNSTTANAVRQISLLDSLEHGYWHKLPHSAMREVGVATLTLSGFFRLTSTSTFAAFESVASMARVPLRTARRHLKKLQEYGYIENTGRSRTNSGRARRTCELKMTPKAKKCFEGEYGVLPWWALCSTNKINSSSMNWAEQAVLSVVMARLMSMKSAVIEQDGHGLSESDIEGSIENMGGSTRYQFSIDYLEQATGLAKQAIVEGKKSLARRGVVVSGGGPTNEYRSVGRSLLIPNHEFFVEIRPASPGKIYVLL